MGLVHAAANVTALTLYSASLAARLRGRRGRGVALALSGIGALGAGGFLGGHLAFGEGLGVDRTAFDSLPEDWTPTIADAALGEGDVKCTEVERRSGHGYTRMAGAVRDPRPLLAPGRAAARG